MIGMMPLTVHRLLPQSYASIGTITRQISDQEWQLCTDFFHPLMTYAYNNGKMRHIPDQVFINISFPADLDVYEKEVRHLATISEENQQREECLPAKF